MSLNDKHLTCQLKKLRHELVAAISGLSQEKLISARETQTDVGTELQTKSEYERTSESGIVQSNLSRLQQSLRTIEEYSKSICNSTAQKVEQLRYQSYTLEKAIITTVMSCQKLSNASVYVLIDSQKDLDSLTDLVQQLVNAETDLIQLRDKRLNDRELLIAGKLISELTQGSQTRWILNDRVDIAIAARADGVHLGQTDLPVADARSQMGANRLIGVSTHNIKQAHAAVLAGANYIGVGPIFPSTTKSFDNFPGLEFAKQVSDEIQLPAFAIGGINHKNVSQVASTGLKRVAVSGCVAGASDPAAVVRKLKNALHDH